VGRIGTHLNLILMFNLTRILKPAVAATLLLISPQFVRAQQPAASLNDADEIRIGKVLADKFEQSEGIAPTPQSMHIEAYLQTVGARVAANAQRQLPYQFHYDPNPTFRSAVGLPGGQVFVGAGLLAFIDSEDQLAVVLGHEIEHIALNQCRDRLVKVLSDQHLSANQADQLKIADFVAPYGHDNELIADHDGAVLAVVAGYSAAAGVRLLQTFLLVAQEVPHAPTDYEKSIRERIALMQAIAEAQQPSPDETPLALH
jgi:predicted Zn-dependent protease